MSMTARELLTALIGACAEEGAGKDKTLLILIMDENGVCSTVKVSKELENMHPGHAELGLCTLNATYYEHYIKPMMDIDRFKVIPHEDTPDSTH